MLARQPVTGFVSDKALALLAYLALHPGLQTRETLAGLLWSDLPAARARANLRVALHNLRQLCPGYLEVTRKQAGFVHEQPHQIDVTIFEHLARQSEAVEALTRAAMLYQDEFLAGMLLDGQAEFEAWQRAEQERLRLLALQVLDRLAEHHTASGAWAEAEQVTRRLLALEPWREASHRRLMLLLARQGQHNAALAQYEQCREILRAELDVEPMRETEALQRRIRSLRTRPQHNLRDGRLPLLGREHELAEVAALLVEPTTRLVTITGLGGVGKSHLAIEVAQRQRSFWLDGVFWVSLTGVQEVQSVVTMLMAAMDMENVSDQTPHARLLDFVREKELLLILDNFEHLLEASNLLSDIERAAPGVTLLVTSRVRLNLQAEQVYPLSGLAYSEWTTTDEAEDDAAVQLFVDYARRADPEFVLRHPDLEPLHAILEATQGMPLALILTAAWVRVMGMAEIASEVGRGLDLLAADYQDMPARQRSVRAVFARTWGRLSAREQRQFAALSVFRGGFTLAAAQAVAGASPLDLRQLADRSLVERSQDEHFAVHELLRQFAAEQLAQQSNAQVVHDAHSAYFLDMLAASRPDLKGRDQLAALRKIRADFENVRAAWHWATAREQWARLPAASEGLYLFALLCSRHEDVRVLLSLARQATAESTTREGQRACAYAALCALSLMSVAGDAPETHVSEAELGAAMERLTDPADVAFGQMQHPAAFAFGHLRRSQHPHFAQRKAEAVAWLRAAHAYFVQAQDPFYAALALWRLGSARTGSVQPQDAAELYRQGLALARQAGDRYVAAGILLDLAGLTAIMNGTTREAESYYRQAAALQQEIGERVLRAIALTETGSVLRWREGDLVEAHAIMEEALAIAAEQNVPYVLAHVLGELIDQRLVEAKYSEVLTLTARVMELGMPDEFDCVRAHVQRGIALLALDRIGEADALMRQGYAKMMRWHIPGVLNPYLAYYGILVAKCGEPTRAVEILAIGLTTAYAKGWMEVDPLITRCREELAATLGEEKFAVAWEQGSDLDAKEEALKMFGDVAV